MEGLFEPINLDALSIDPKDLHLASSVLGRWAAYADHKARAMELRAAGDLEAALSFERSCAAQYKQLPDWAKW